MKIRFHETFDQFFKMGVESLPVILFCMVIVASMSLLEFSYHMKLVLKQDALVPAFSTLLLVKELAPVVTSLLLASRIGAGMAAEIGMMRVSEQIDQLRLLGVSPFEFLILPRVLGAVFACVTLSSVALAFSFLSSALFSGIWMGHSSQEFLHSSLLFTNPKDLLDCVVKPLIFGFIIGGVACFQGLRCDLGSRGVGEAATHAVVRSSLLIIILDFVITLTLSRLII